MDMNLQGLRGRFQAKVRPLLLNREAALGTTFAAAIALFCLVGPLFSPYHLDWILVDASFQPPNLRHWFGTDRLGRDVLLQVMVAGRTSLAISAAATVIMVTLGSILGITAGYFGSWIDSVISRLTEVFMIIPRIPLLITLAAVMSDLRIDPAQRIYMTMLVVGVTSWPRLCRLVRGQMLILREMEYMQAVTVLGLSNVRKMYFHLLPNIWPTILVFASLGMAMSIVAESTLSFLGLGVVPPTPSWGNMIAGSNTLLDLQKRPWLWISPGFFIVATTVSIYIVGSGLRKAWQVNEGKG